MRSRRRTLVALAVLAAAAVVAWLVAGRGGEDKGGRLTHVQLVERADGVCGGLARENESLRPPPRPYDAQSADFFAGVHEHVKEAKKAFDELQAPPADAPALDRLVELYGTLDGLMDQVESAASVEQDQEVVTLLDEIGELTRSIAASERALGICRGKDSARISVAVLLRRTRPNPLTETGTLEP